MNDQRVQFGARLRQQREAKALTVPDVAKLTKIPEKSVSLLEGGALEELPAEVFVRGFIKSYCRTVGLDVDATLRDYEGLRERRPRVPSLARLGVMRGDSAQVTPVGTPAPQPIPGPVADKPPEKERDDVSIFSALASAGNGPGRMGLTLAVIVLVIVATLTLSLLLRRPGKAGVGDGVSVTTAMAQKIA